ncbi:hypothetical protein MLO71_20105, partial [Escherichia coli]|nr:hypothetical protein [Escherichia coli]
GVITNNSFNVWLKLGCLSISPPPQRIFFAIRQEVHLSVAAGVISPLTGLGCFVVLPLTGGAQI